jgi:hypothetical protein
VVDEARILGLLRGITDDLAILRRESAAEEASTLDDLSAIGTVRRASGSGRASAVRAVRLHGNPPSCWRCHSGGQTTCKGAASSSGDIVRYHWEVPMSDVLIRDIPDDVLAGLGVLAGRIGLSRSAYIRRRLTQEARRARTPVTVEHFRRFADTFVDLGDPELMTRAWE